MSLQEAFYLGTLHLHQPHHPSHWVRCLLVRRASHVCDAHMWCYSSWYMHILVSVFVTLMLIITLQLVAHPSNTTLQSSVCIPLPKLCGIYTITWSGHTNAAMSIISSCIVHKSLLEVGKCSCGLFGGLLHWQFGCYCSPETISLCVS